MKKVERIFIVGLGPGDQGSLTREAWNVLSSGLPVFVRTAKHPVVKELRQVGVEILPLDHFYEAESFEQVYERMAAFLVSEARAKGSIVYAVPGHPLVGEKTVQILFSLAEKENICIKVASAVSSLDAIFTLLGIDPLQGVMVHDAYQLPPLFDPHVGHIIMQVHNRYLAAEVKLTLMGSYPDEVRVAIVQRAGLPEGNLVTEIPLVELDRLDIFDDLTAIYVPACDSARVRLSSYPLDRLVGIMARLRGKDGCPWDRQQTHATLKKYLLEEAYEVVEAIDKGDTNNLVEELGDLLLQVVFHAQLGSEAGEFDINDVIEKVVDKMERRHPHVFGALRLRTSEQVLKKWDEIKGEEKEQEPASLVFNVSKALPALKRAQKVQEAAARIGFDWEELSPVAEKLREEMGELQDALNSRDLDTARAELGDLLFAAVNLARFLGVDAEEVMHRATEKFINRFAAMSKEAKDHGRRLDELSLEELDELWNQIKNMPCDGEKLGEWKEN